MKNRRFLIMIAAAAVLFAAAVFIVYPRESAYRKAVRLQEQGETAEACGIFRGLGGWRDSAERASALSEADPELALTFAGKWDVVPFGHFDQDGDPGSGPEPLEWYVVCREEDEEEGIRLLLLCRDCIACAAYHTPGGDITWERSTVREYLNSTFIQTAFSPREQSLLEEVTLENPGNERLGIDGGPDTEDRVFLLSALEYSVYFQQDEARWLYARAQASSRAQSEGIYLSGQDPAETVSPEESGYARWWLRSPGNEAYGAQIVEEDGTVFEGGASVDIDYMYGLRPAMWVRLDQDASGQAVP